MAEIGIVASCLQIADTTVKLKRLWSSIRNGPKELQELVEEIVISAEILADIEQCHQAVNDSSLDILAWRNCARLFQKVAEELRQLTDELQTVLKQHKRTGAARIYVKSGELERRKERFRRVQMLMINSQQAYSHSFTTQNFSRVLKELQTISLLQRTLPEASEWHVSKNEADNSVNATAENTNSKIQQTVCYARPERSTAFTLQFPWWLMRRSFQILVQKSNASWGITFRTYNRLGHNSPLFSAAEAGNWALVQHLFATRQASPFDIDLWEQDLLYVAASRFQLDACRMLLSHGLDPSRGDDTFWGQTTVARMGWAASFDPIIGQNAEAQGIVFLFAGFGADAFCYNDGTLTYGFRNCHASFLQSVISSVYPDYYRLTHAQRISMAFKSDNLDVDRLKLFLGHDFSLNDAFKIALAENLEHNHLSLLAMAGQSHAITASSGHYDKDLLQIVQSIVAFEAKNSGSKRYCSALHNFLEHYFDTHGWHPKSHDLGAFNQHVTDITRLWIRVLKNAGANLDRYALAERMLLQPQQRFRYRCNGQAIVIERDDRHPVVFEVRYLVGGLEIEDWKVFVVSTSVTHFLIPGEGRDWIPIVIGHNEYEMANEFWSWTEELEHYDIPGSFNSACVTDIESSWPGEPMDPEAIKTTGPVL